MDPGSEYSADAVAINWSGDTFENAVMKWRFDATDIYGNFITTGIGGEFEIEYPAYTAETQTINFTLPNQKCVGTVTAKNIAVTNTTSNSYWIRGGTVTVTGDISANGSADNGMAIAGACKIKSDTITISNVTKNDGIRTEGSSTIEANTIHISNIQSQGIRITKINTIKVDIVIIDTTVAENGLWIANTATEQPTIQITNLVLNSIGNKGVASSVAITNSNLNIGTLWYANFTNYKSDSVDAGCFGEVKNELPTT